MGLRNDHRPRIAVFLLVSLSAVMAMPGTVFADHTVENWGTYTNPPNFYFNKNHSQTDNSQLELFMTDAVSGIRYRIASRAGSGSGSTDQCYTNNGWLPNGAYGRDDNDPNSYVEQMYKTWGNTTVRGQVWALGDKWCGSKYRTELFIHSNGIEGTPWNNNWKTEGCIKVSQHARDGFVAYWWSAYDGNNERLLVS